MLGISTTNLRVNGFRGLSFVKKIIAAFKARVLADSGTFEAESCLTTIVQDLVNNNLYDSASLIVTPNAVKAGKIYALKGTDLTFTRASVANRTNSVGAIESMATGVPRIEYPSGGGCPSILLEPQRTNLFLNSFTPVTQTITVVNGSMYTVSINGGTATLSDAGAGSATTGSNRTFTATSTSLTITITGSPTWCQVELGSFATSPIITTGAAVTRIADLVTTGAISFGSDTGSYYFQNNYTQTVGIGQPYWNGISEGTAINNSFKNIVCYDSSIFHNLGGGFNLLATFAGGDKICYTWNSTTLLVYKNGTQVASFNKTGITFNPILFNPARDGAALSSIIYNIKHIALPITLTPSQAIALTT